MFRPGRLAMQSKLKRPYDPQALPPRQRLRRNVQDLVGNNALASDRLTELARDIHRVDAGSFADVARIREGGNHQARDLRKVFLKSTAWMPLYWAQVRVKNIKSGKLESQWLAISLPHEIVHVLQRQGILEKILERDGMDTLTRQHLEKCEGETRCKLLGLGIWADGTPCNWDRTETVDTVCLNLPGQSGEWKNLRIPITALSHKHVCEETWHDVNAVIKWSLLVLATGEWPTCRHDGTPWLKSDAKRKRPKSGLQKACLVEVRADWDWMAKVYGFPPHNLAAGNCWKCKCTPDQVMGYVPDPHHYINMYIHINIQMY